MTRIAYLGPAGTFTEQAARQFSIDGAEYEPVDSPAAALAALGAGADPGPQRWLDQKHVHQRDCRPGGVTHYRPASS